MALKTRFDYYGLTTGIKTERLYPISRMLSAVTGLAVQRNKAIVGRNAFAHESGIHQDGMLKERSTYEIMRPKTSAFPRPTWCWASIPAGMRSAIESRSWVTR